MPHPTEQVFAIRYLTRYAYSSEVADNLNALRVRPASSATQRVEEFAVRLSPDVRQQHHVDYFGSEVVEFEVARPHDELVIDVRTRVATSPPPPPPASSWADAATDDYREAAGEFLFRDDTGLEHPTLTSMADALARADDPVEAARTVSELIPDRFDYRRGATYVDSPLQAVLDGGAGVCQDFVHLGLHLLRERGIGARYVSGYLYALAEDAVDDAEATSVEVDTHAWIEVLIPGRDGSMTWVGIDPTNRGFTGTHHVKIGHGRHYGDVPPIKGVYRGNASSTLEASVTMTRLPSTPGR